MLNIKSYKSDQVLDLIYVADSGSLEMLVNVRPVEGLHRAKDDTPFSV